MTKDHTESTVRRLFLYSVSVIFFVTGCAKILSAQGSASLLTFDDPIFHLRFRTLMTTVGVIEVVIAMFCMLKRYNLHSMFLTAWISTNFLLYRLWLWLIGWRQPCHCLGTLTDAIHLSPRYADLIVKALLSYLLLGSYYFLFLEGMNISARKAAIK
jgi:hypothetical protein